MEHRALSTEHGAGSTEHARTNARSMEHEARSTEHARTHARSTEHGAWSMEHGARSMQHARSTEHGIMMFLFKLDEVTNTVCRFLKFLISMKVPKFYITVLESHLSHPKHCQFSRFSGSGRC